MFDFFFFFFLKGRLPIFSGLEGKGEIPEVFGLRTCRQGVAFGTVKGKRRITKNK